MQNGVASFIFDLQVSVSEPWNRWLLALSDQYKLAFGLESVINAWCCVEWKRRDRGAAGRSPYTWQRTRIKPRTARQTGRFAHTWFGQSRSGRGRYRLARISGRLEIDRSKCGQQSLARYSHRDRLSGRGRNSARSQWSRDR